MSLSHVRIVVSMLRRRLEDGGHMHLLRPLWSLLCPTTFDLMARLTTKDLRARLFFSYYDALSEIPTIAY